MNPRILLAVSTLSAGGAERVISELANAWAEKGWQAGVLTLSAQCSDHYGLPPSVTRIALDLMWDSRSIWQSIAGNLRRSGALRKAVRGFDPDAVLSFVEQTNVRLLAAMLGSGVPVIVSERTDPRQHEVGRAWRLVRLLLYPFARRVVVQTVSVAGWAQGFLPARKVRVIPNFVRALPEVPGWTQRHEDEILAVGRLGREKGFDVLLRAFAAGGLMAQGVRLTILGEGPERAALEGLARELGVAGAVSLPGVVKDPERWMARATVFVMSSRYEGFPNALIEAMAMGCPVIAADCDSGPREIIRNEEDGLLVPPEDAEALSGALVRLMGDAALRERLGKGALSVRERFSKEHIMNQWESLIDEVLAR